MIFLDHMLVPHVYQVWNKTNNVFGMHSDANLSILMITITVISVATHQSSVKCSFSG